MTQMLGGLKAFLPPLRLPSPWGSSRACCSDGWPPCDPPSPSCHLPLCGDTAVSTRNLSWWPLAFDLVPGRESPVVRFMDSSVICSLGRSSLMRREIPEIKIFEADGSLFSFSMKDRVGVQDSQPVSEQLGGCACHISPRDTAARVLTAAQYSEGPGSGCQRQDLRRQCCPGWRGWRGAARGCSFRAGMLGVPSRMPHGSCSAHWHLCSGTVTRGSAVCAECAGGAGRCPDA